MLKVITMEEGPIAKYNGYKGIYISCPCFETDEHPDNHSGECCDCRNDDCSIAGSSCRGVIKNGYFITDFDNPPHTEKIQPGDEIQIFVRNEEHIKRMCEV